MTKHLVFIVLIFLNYNLSAQINDLLKDKNIVWVGAFTTDFVVEGYNALDTSDYINSVRLLKYLNTKSDYDMDTDRPFLSKIENAFSKDLLFFYHQNTFINRINPLPSVDTIEVINPTTYEKMYKVVYHCGYIFPTPRYYRADQILFYDRKKKNFGLRVLAICLIVDEHDAVGNIAGLRELGWIKTSPKTIKKVKLNTPNISLATRLNTRSNSPSFETDFKVLKNTIGNIQQTFIDDMTRKTSIDLYNPDDYAQKLSKQEKDKILKAFRPSSLTSGDSNTLITLKKETIRRRTSNNRMDDFPDFISSKKDSINNKAQADMDEAFPKFTASVSDTSSHNMPTTDKEGFPDFNQFGDSNFRDSVAFNSIKEVYKLKIVQDWYWDEKLNTIAVRLFAVAPMIKMFDYNGNHLYDRSVFFRLND